MLWIFTSDGKMDMNIVMTAILDNLTASMNFKTPTWIVPTNSVASVLPNGYGCIEYKGPPPKVIKL